jgi:hypothetical protein
MTPSEWRASALEDLADREADRNPRCIICDESTLVGYSIDLGAYLCQEHHDDFNAWADANPDELYDDWPPINPIGRLFPAGTPAHDVEHVTVPAMGAALVLAAIIGLFVASVTVALNTRYLSGGTILAALLAVAAAMLGVRFIKAGAR